MKKDQIIQMAREAIARLEDRYKMGGLSTGLYGDFACDVALEVAAAIRSATKEEDAENCITMADGWDDPAEEFGMRLCAKAIRASK